MPDPVVVVFPDRGLWRAHVDGGGTSEAFSERYPALEWAHRYAQAHRPSRVRVMTKPGEVEDEWAYGAFKGIRRIGPRIAAAEPRR